MKNPQPTHPLRCRTGFSLVEVTLALGIFSFTAVVILGLLPGGLVSSQRASHVTLGSRLASEVQAELQQVGLASFQTNTTTFDVDGRIVVDAQGGAVGTTPPVFDVCRTVVDCALPGAATSPLKRVVVQVINNPGRKTMSRDAASGLVAVPGDMEGRTFEFHVVAQ